MTRARLIRTLLYRWRLIVGAVLVCLAIAIATILFASPTYRATAAVVINNTGSDTIGTQTDPAEELLPDFMATQLDILTSDRVAQLVVAKLQLGQSDLTARRMGYKGRGPLEAFLAKALQTNLRVGSGGGKSHVIQISFIANDPKFAADVANAFAESFADASIDLKSEPARQTAKWYTTRLADLQKQLITAQERLTIRQAQLGIVNQTGGNADSEDVRLQALTGQLAAAQAQSAVTVNRAAGTVADTLQNPVIQAIQGQIAQLEGKRRQLATSVGPNNPDYRQVVSELAGMRAQLSEQRQQVQGASSARSQLASSSVAQLQADVHAQRRRAIENHARTDQLSVLQQDVRNLQTVYDQMAARR